MLPERVYAYVDPGTGSYVFQVIVAFILGGLFSVKLFWRRIIDFIKSVTTLDGGEKKSSQKGK
jgi:hypothetical protein